MRNGAPMMGRHAPNRGPACQDAARGCRCFWFGGPSTKQTSKRVVKRREQRNTRRMIVEEINK
jgi:hypothetical protein